MNELLEQLCNLAKERGGTHACIVTDREYLKAYEAVRECCLSNACGKSGRCWTCPPHVGEFDELSARLLSYPGAMIVQSIAALEDSWDFEGMEEASRVHNNLIRELGSYVETQFPGYKSLSLGCGGCGFCERCNCPDEPCRFPEKALSSVEGYGLDVKALVESVGLQYINGQNTVSYVGMIMVCPKD